MLRLNVALNSPRPKEASKLQQTSTGKLVTCDGHKMESGMVRLRLNGIHSPILCEFVSGFHDCHRHLACPGFGGQARLGASLMRRLIIKLIQSGAALHVPETANNSLANCHFPANHILPLLLPLQLKLLTFYHLILPLLGFYTIVS